MILPLLCSSQELKNGLPETESKANSWRWFHLMDKAMTGQLASSASVLNPSLFAQDDLQESTTGDIVGSSRIVPGLEQAVVSGQTQPTADGSVELDVATVELLKAFKQEDEAAVELLQALKQEGGESEDTCYKPPTVFYATEVSNSSVNLGTVLYATIECDNDGAGEGNPSVQLDDVMDRTPVNTERDMMMEIEEPDRRIEQLERERRALEKEQLQLDRERLVLKRERELVRQQMEAIERDRASLDKHRAAVERCRAALERDRALMERDRALLERERLEVYRQKEAFPKEKPDGTRAELDADSQDSRQRLMSLLERFIDKL